MVALALVRPVLTAVANGRGGEIRTHDLYVPNVALYQAKLRPDYIWRVTATLWTVQQREW